VQTGYHDLDLPPWVTTYWMFTQRYFKNLLNNFFFKKIEKSWKCSSHYYVMVYIKKLLKICHCQKASSPFTSPFIKKTLVTMFSKCFWVFFIHYINFRLLKYIYQYIENNIIWKKLHLEFCFFSKMLYTQNQALVTLLMYMLVWLHRFQLWIYFYFY
jgi:hypothetical protein